MSYTKNPNAPGARDGVIPEEISALRPALDTRPHMVPNYEDERVRRKHDSIRGDERDNSKAWFNRALRSGASDE